MNFASDNWAGAAPEILQSIARANEGIAPAYGGDDLTAQLTEKFSTLFEKDVTVFLTATGGAANGLALSVLTPPYGMALCHEEAHVQMDECAGPEFFTGGAKLLPVSGANGKLTPQSIASALKGFPERPPHGAPATALSVTQASECGTVYTVNELKEICTAANSASLRVHMDGARFANAVAHLKCSPADLTWRAGVDIMSFGGTKNGCFAAEAIIVFGDVDLVDLEYRRKRAGQLFSKMRFFSAQFDAYLTDDLWLKLARKANAAAARLSKGLTEISGCKVWYPTQANEVFASFPDGVAEKLRTGGAKFYPWITPGDPGGGTINRLICSFQTSDDEIDRFLESVTAGINTP